jgi:hypothetical protein
MIGLTFTVPGPWVDFDVAVFDGCGETDGVPEPSTPTFCVLLWWAPESATAIAPPASAITTNVVLIAYADRRRRRICSPRCTTPVRASPLSIGGVGSSR